MLNSIKVNIINVSVKKKVGRLMRYKRDEPFRYQFDVPVDGNFVILLNNVEADKLTRSDTGELKVSDISPGGMSFITELDLPTNQQDYMIEVKLQLIDQEIVMHGHIVWKEKKGEHYTYGLQGVIDEETEQLIVQAVKAFNKQIRDEKK